MLSPLRGMRSAEGFSRWASEVEQQQGQLKVDASLPDDH